MNNYVVTIIHGSKEHSARYNEFSEILKKNNIECVLNDLYDHGKNLKGDFHNFSFDDMLKSALEIIDYSKEKFPKHKQIIFGHSMGSFIVKYITYNNIREFDAIILSGTNNVNNLLLLLLLFLTKHSKQNVVSQFNEKLIYGSLSLISKIFVNDYNWLTNDVKIQQEFVEDSLCGNDFSNSSLYSMLMFIKNSQKKHVLKNFKNKNCPQLILFGKQDPISFFGSNIKTMIKRQKKYNINFQKVISYEKTKHEVLFDIKKDEVIIDIVKYIKEF